MNKQEAIKKIEKEKSGLNAWADLTRNRALNDALAIVRKINEPQKVVLPRFVAEWLEGCKRSGWNLQKALSRLDDDEKVGDWAYDENDYLINEKVEVFARAWLDGCEIEQEKLYTVEIPNNGGTLVLARVHQSIKLVDGNKHFPGNFTKELIENAGFHWALKWAKPVEEVE